jgi:ABC-type branched-subunit amino acid transport system permease subunit
MLHNQNERFWRVVAQYLSGSIAIALLTFVCFRLRFDLATTAFLYLIVIVLLSLQGYTTKPGGLGMGLSISRSIMDGHRGRLWATANPGHGATFHFALPALR